MEKEEKKLTLHETIAQSLSYVFGNTSYNMKSRLLTDIKNKFSLQMPNLQMENINQGNSMLTVEYGDITLKFNVIWRTSNLMPNTYVIDKITT